MVMNICFFMTCSTENVRHWVSASQSKWTVCHGPMKIWSWAVIRCNEGFSNWYVIERSAKDCSRPQFRFQISAYDMIHNIICYICSRNIIKKTGYEIGLQKYVDEKLNTFVAICQQEALEHSSCLKVIWSKLEVWVWDIIICGPWSTTHTIWTRMHIICSIWFAEYLN